MCPSCFKRKIIRCILSLCSTINADLNVPRKGEVNAQVDLLGGGLPILKSAELGLDTTY